MFQGSVDAIANFVLFFGEKVDDDSTQKVQQGGGNGWMRLDGVVHDQDGGLDVHDIVILWLEEKPVVEQGQFGVASGHLAGTSGEEPTDHSPSGNNV